MNNFLITAEDARKIYRSGPKEVRAVDGISLEVKRGDHLAIVGPSGAGKSTLMHLMGGLDKPTSGKISLDGADIYKMPDRRRAALRNRKIGFVFQFYHLLPEFTALENVMMPAIVQLSAFSFRRSAIKKDAIRILDSVRLKGRMDHRPAELSGGESQRVAIARALVNKPEILFCDEPTGNLDSKTSESIYELLFDLNSKFNMALIVVTHDEGVASRFKKKIHIKDGKII